MQALDLPFVFAAICQVDIVQTMDSRKNLLAFVIHGNQAAVETVISIFRFLLLDETLSLFGRDIHFSDKSVEFWPKNGTEALPSAPSPHCNRRRALEIPRCTIAATKWKTLVVKWLGQILLEINVDPNFLAGRGFHGGGPGSKQQQRVQIKNSLARTLLEQARD